MNCVIPIILCGGSGTRLWPLSTPDRPKQFLALTSDKAMIAETADRFADSELPTLDFANVKVVGSKKHRLLLQDTLPNADLILEPFGRNSAPAVAAACLVSAPEDLILILPADHGIADVAAFHQAISQAIPAATDGNILTFGLEPTYPATGYGYIQAEDQASHVRPVKAFVEKPSHTVAESYIEQGNYYWNAGIFLFQAQTMIAALEAFAPDILPAVGAALAGQSGQIQQLAPEHFAQAPDISIDYAVMEHAQNVQVVPVEMGWSDVGDYQALHELFAEPNQTVVTSGPAFVRDSQNVYVNSQGPAIAVSGVSDLTIIATNDTIMVNRAGDSAAVKALGQHVGTQRHQLAVSEPFCDGVKTWLWDTFEYWADKAWDETLGGFVEQLSLTGAPDLQSPRRVRVQARQVFSFARALQYGWSQPELARRHVQSGLNYIDQKLRHPEGGWVHIVDAEGQAINDTRDLYDHAFLILAGATTYEATGDALGLTLAREACAFINQHLKAGAGQGWYEALPHQLPRRANPHMHLLEASCALYRATGELNDLAIATECVGLFESHFFNPRLNILGEFFQSDWSPVAGDQETVFEAGHMYEWASLLHEYDRLTGHDSLSWRRRLIRCADKYVDLAGTGFALNAQRPDGVEVNSKRRLWPQLERFRAHLLHPEMAPFGTPERLYLQIKSTYSDCLPTGLWVDEFTPDGQRYSNTIPASMLYHLITAYAPIL